MSKKKCTQCGFENKDESPFCNNCGYNLLLDGDITDDENDNKGDKLGIYSLLLFFGGWIISCFIAYVFDLKSIFNFIPFVVLSSLAGIVLSIYGKIKYPKNNAIKKSLIFIIGILILLFLYAFVISSMVVSGCEGLLSIG